MRASVLAFVVCAIYASRVAGAPLVNTENAVEARSPRGGRFNVHVGLPNININSPPPQQRSFDEIEVRSPRGGAGHGAGGHHKREEIEARSPRVKVGGKFNLNVGLPTININSPQQQPQQRSLDDIEARSPLKLLSNVGAADDAYRHKYSMSNFINKPKYARRSFDGEELEARTPRGGRGGRGGGRGRGRPGSAGVEARSPGLFGKIKPGRIGIPSFDLQRKVEARSFDDMELEARTPKAIGFHPLTQLHIPISDFRNLSPPPHSRSFEEELEARTPRGGFRGGFHGMGHHPDAPAPQARSFDDMELEARTPKLLSGKPRLNLHIPIPTFDVQSPPPQSRSFNEELEARTPRGGFRGGFKGRMGGRPGGAPPQERSFDDELEVRAPRGGFRGGFKGRMGGHPGSAPPQERSFDEQLEARAPRGGFRGGFKGRMGGRPGGAPPQERSFDEELEARAPRGGFRGFKGHFGGRRGGFKPPMASPPADAPADQPQARGFPHGGFRGGFKGRMGGRRGPGGFKPPMAGPPADAPAEQ